MSWPGIWGWQQTPGSGQDWSSLLRDSQLDPVLRPLFLSRPLMSASAAGRRWTICVRLESDIAYDQTPPSPRWEAAERQAV